MCFAWENPLLKKTNVTNFHEMMLFYLKIKEKLPPTIFPKSRFFFVLYSFPHWVPVICQPVKVIIIYYWYESSHYQQWRFLAYPFLFCAQTFTLMPYSRRFSSTSQNIISRTDHIYRYYFLFRLYTTIFFFLFLFRLLVNAIHMLICYNEPLTDNNNYSLTGIISTIHTLIWCCPQQISMLLASLYIITQLFINRGLLAFLTRFKFNNIFYTLSLWRMQCNVITLESSANLTIYIYI